MRQSGLAVDTVPRRTALRRGEGTVAALRALPLQAPCRIRLRLAVASIDVFALRQTMHRALGELARAYVVKVDYRHGQTTMHVDLARGDRDAAMHAIMMALPAAEFGTTTALGA
ncbi:hypothetical protein [Cupriavidus lacunae]|uniref:Uncharacterized protein n=1 Tax=Cupriavidus lacunae TaxID=2666307 RepID=A0A370NIP4_9BURK|nr:hypothetical protein [Cupriavidus lacunae]RDK05476.1 hypothetical protein DN412_36780 [Cupriavidus lacunae]